MGNMCGGGFGDLERPPSRSNMSLFAIIELVIMGVLAIFCLVELINLFKNDSSLNNVDTILRIIVDFLIVIGLCLIVYGLFCAMSPSPIRSGILCYLLAALISLVVIIYYFVQGSGITFYQFVYAVFLLFLAYFLWRQSGHL